MGKITDNDVENIHELERYLKEPRTLGEMASHLGVSQGQVISYLEIFLKNPRRYRVQCSDLAGPEKKWVAVQ